jgi:fatty acid desaturase
MSQGRLSPLSADISPFEEKKPMTKHRDGQSTAAWTAVAIVLLAALVISVAIVVGSWPVAIVGIVLVVVGAAAGKILAMAGFGQGKPKPSAKSTHAR